LNSSFGGWCSIESGLVPDSNNGVIFQSGAEPAPAMPIPAPIDLGKGGFVVGNDGSMIDTTGLSASMLRRKVADELLEPEAPGKLALSFVSFGHKHGPPRDADLAFDVRFLPNPHYDPNLRPLTGFDQRIVDYVGRDGRLEVFYSHLIPLLEFVLPQYVAEGKAHLMVAIGCTGGRHRSVAITEHLAKLFRDRDEYFVEVAHRDVDRLPIRR